jgi:hypothetical protein
MTLEKLLKCSVAELKAMDSVQLEKYFAPYLNVTRPSRVVKPTSKVKRSSNENAKAAQINDMLKGLGINVKL